jgi:hypothetical protein
MLLLEGSSLNVLLVVVVVLVVYGSTAAVDAACGG